MAELPQLVAHAKKRAPGFARILADVDPRKVKIREGARDAAGHAQERPRRRCRRNCRRSAASTPRRSRSSASSSSRPGPIYDPEGRGTDWWRTARGLFAGGFRAGDRVLNTFAYHFTPAGSMLESGAAALGCTVIPGGVGPDRDAGRGDPRPAAQRLRRHALVPQADRREGRRAEGRHLVPAEGAGRRRVSAARAATSAAASAASASRRCYASADLGLIAYESLMPDGTVNEGMILDEAPDPRDRAPRHRRPGRAGRGGRGGDHLASTRTTR